MKYKTEKNISLDDYFLFALTVFFTLAFFLSHGSPDVDRFWLNWMQLLADHPRFRDGFDAIWADYPPLSILFLSGLQKLSMSFQWNVFVLLKSSVLIFLLATTGVYYYISRNIRTALLMHGMLLLSSIMLTYLDIYYAPCLLLSLWALRSGKWRTAIVLFAICCAIKYQPVIIAPFFLAYVWIMSRASQKEKSTLPILRFFFITGMSYLVAMYLLVGQPLFVSFYNALFHARFSFQALNIYWVYVQGMITLAGADEAGIRGAPLYWIYTTRLLFLAFYIVLLTFFLKRGKTFTDFLLYAMAGFYSYFILVSGVHENHLFIAAILASVLFIFHEEYRSLALFVMLMANVNLLLFNGLTGEGLSFPPVFIIDMTIPIAILNALFYFYLVYHLLTQRYMRLKK